jgi:hypothetical protein
MRILVALIAAACVGLAAGCSDESVAPNTGQNPGTIQGTIGDSDFELTFKTAGDPGDPLDGPFVLRGSNVHYVDSLHALSVDLTVTNRGRVSQPEPIGLTFLRLYPAGVTVLNPDNGINGNGAAIVFAFANDDAFWTPGEHSLPRTVQFAVDPGVSIGFIARLDIGAPGAGGTIAGRVWHDANKDGVADPDEGGLPGVLITLRSIDDGPTTNVLPEMWRTLTGEDGHYEFHGLAPGVYIVSKALATTGFFPTTPTEITIVLTMHDGVVSDFLGADFGCVPISPPPPPPIEVGAWVQTRGTYEPLPEPHLVATAISVSYCGDDTIPDPGIGIRQDCNAGVLRGLVTDVNSVEHVVRVMGTPIYFPTIPLPYAGQRIEVHVMQPGNVGAWTAVVWEPWGGEADGVDGRVQFVGPGPDDVIRIRVVDTWIVPANIVVKR